MMKYYATVASVSVVKSQDTVERIERRVLDSNPVMEAFGKRNRGVSVNVKTESHKRSLIIISICFV